MPLQPVVVGLRDGRTVGGGGDRIGPAGDGPPVEALQGKGPGVEGRQPVLAAEATAVVAFAVAACTALTE